MPPGEEAPVTERPGGRRVDAAVADATAGSAADGPAGSIADGPAESTADATAGSTAAATAGTAAAATAGTAADAGSAARAPLRRLHPLTPVVRGWRVIAVALAALGQDALRNPNLAQFAGLALGVLPVAAAYGFLSWRFTRFRIEGGDLRLQTGVLFRRTRHVHLDRLQAVDLVRPLLARFAGLAELRLEVAGGSGVEASLAYLTESEAHRLRAELLARAAGLAPHSDEAPEHVLVTVPALALLGSIALSVPTAISFLAGLGLLVTAAVTGEFQVALAVVPPGIGLVGTAFRRFAAHFDFTVADSPDGLRLRHGLLEHRSQTVPPGRVQSLRIVEPLLWRSRGWVRVQVNIAGYAGAHGREEAGSADLLPVAPRAVALAVIGRVLPGVDVDAVVLRPAPRRARWLRPLTWWRLACGSDATVFVARRGVLQRQLDVIPHEKIQSVRLHQGPLQRALGLSTVHLDTTAGPVHVTAEQRALPEAAAIVQAEAEQSRHARRNARPHRWMTGAGTPPAAPAGPPAAPPTGPPAAPPD